MSLDSRISYPPEYFLKKLKNPEYTIRNFPARLPILGAPARVLVTIPGYNSSVYKLLTGVLAFAIEVTAADVPTPANFADYCFICPIKGHTTLQNLAGTQISGGSLINQKTPDLNDLRNFFMVPIGIRLNTALIDPSVIDTPFSLNLSMLDLLKPGEELNFIVDYFITGAAAGFLALQIRTCCFEGDLNEEHK